MSVKAKAPKTATRSQLVLLTVTFCKLVIALLITIILGRNLQAEDFGFFALVNTVFIVGRDLLDLGTGNIAVREIARDPSKECIILESLLAWRALLGGLLAALCVALAMRQQVDYQRWALIAAAAVLAIMYLSAYTTVFQVQQSHEAASILDFSSQLLVLLLCYAGSRWHMPSGFYPFLIVMREAIVVSGKKILAVNMLGYSPKPKLYGSELKIFLGKALTFGMAALTYNIYFHSGTFLIWLFRPEQELGVYTAALRPIYPLLLFPWLFMIPMVPVLSKLAHSDYVRFSSQVKDLLLLALGIGAAGSVTGSSLADSVIGVLYGNKFSLGSLAAVEAFRLFAFAFGFSCISPVLAIALLAEGREKHLQRLTLLGLLVNLGCNYWLLPQLGYLASAYSTVITEITVCLGGLLLLRKSLQPLKYTPDAGLVLYPAALSGGILFYLSGPQWFEVGCGFLLGSVCVAILWFSPVARRLRYDLNREAEQIN